MSPELFCFVKGAKLTYDPHSGTRDDRFLEEAAKQFGGIASPCPKTIKRVPASNLEVGILCDHVSSPQIASHDCRSGFMKPELEPFWNAIAELSPSALESNDWCLSVGRPSGLGSTSYGLARQLNISSKLASQRLRSLYSRGYVNRMEVCFWSDSGVDYGYSYYKSDKKPRFGNKYRVAASSGGTA